MTDPIASIIVVSVILTVFMVVASLWFAIKESWFSKTEAIVVALKASIFIIFALCWQPIAIIITITVSIFSLLFDFFNFLIFTVIGACRHFLFPKTLRWKFASKYLIILNIWILSNAFLFREDDLAKYSFSLPLSFLQISLIIYYWYKIKKVLLGVFLTPLIWIPYLSWLTFFVTFFSLKKYDKNQKLLESGEKTG